MRLRKVRAMLVTGYEEPEVPEFGFAQRVWFRLWLARKKLGWFAEKIGRCLR